VDQGTWDVVWVPIASFSRTGASASETVIPTIGSIVASRFQLVRELGRGGMGSVWLADHLTLQLRCAVKFMSGDAQRDPNFRTRFEFEARAIAQLHSAHVVRILDYAVADDVPFIAMEFLQGEDLGSRLGKVGRLDAPTTYRIVSQVARGLAKAHLAGLVHRDIKPENIFLAQEDDEEIVKLLDFGVAKSAAFSLQGMGTQAGSLIGTPAYMSPEQARGTAQIDHRSDLWSLAVIAYQCLTGSLPFESPTLGDLFGRIMYEAMPVPSKVAPWLSPEFDAWWERAASRDVDQRFSNARDLADALGQALAIPGITTDTSGAWGERRPPEPSTPPVTTTPAPPPLTVYRASANFHDVNSTHAPVTRSSGSSRRLVRSLYVAALVGAVAIVIAIGFFSPRTGVPASALGTATAPGTPASASQPPPPVAASGPSEFELPPHTVENLAPSANDLPIAPSAGGAEPSATSREPTSRGRLPAPTTAPPPPRSGRASPKGSSGDVDFCI
jgi:serine/threonine protein kinase